MAKMTVNALLGDQLAKESPAEAATVQPGAPSGVSKAEASEVPHSGGSSVTQLQAVQEELLVVNETKPKYLRLERKDTRLRLDQLEGLAVLARRLQKGRARGSGERITENTLIRVGVDLVLALTETLPGAVDEGELRHRALAQLAGHR